MKRYKIYLTGNSEWDGNELPTTLLLDKLISDYGELIVKVEDVNPDTL